MRNIKTENLLCHECFGHHKETKHDSTEVSCPVCGNYDIVGTLSSILPGEKYKNKRPILSVMVRRGWEYSNKSKPFEVHTKIADELISEYSNISVEDRINALIDYLGENAPPGEHIDMRKNDFVTYSTNAEQHFYFLKYLDEIGLADHDTGICRLTPEGWERFADVNAKLNSKVCFIAMSYSNKEVSEDYETVIQPLLKELGFDPIVIKDVEHNEDIVFKIISEIEKCRFLIADVRDFKNNVYYEAGYAMALRKEVIWHCKEEDVDDLEFDTRNLNHIVWKDKKQLREKLENRIKATVLIK